MIFKNLTQKTSQWFENLKSGISKTKEGFVGKIQNLFSFRKKIDDELWEELEEILIMGDVGVTATDKLISLLKAKVKERKISESSLLYDVFKEICSEILQSRSNDIIFNTDGLSVFIVVGVNGTGKTTTIAKLAHRLKEEGKKVMLAACDTFRAAAIEQLEIWSQRAGVELVKHTEGSDPSAVLYDAIHAARARNMDVLIVDTAGRLHSKVNLMKELEKVKKVAGQQFPGAPHEVLLVLDAVMGQNALIQAKKFNEVTNVTGIVLTKLDSTAKGGIIFSIYEDLKIPVKFIGIGEAMTDLREFVPLDFVEALFERESKDEPSENK